MKDQAGTEAPTGESTEHATITQATHTLALAVEAAHMSREAWLTQLRLGLAEVLASLAEHQRAAEGEAGILAEMDVRLGTCEHVSGARQAHTHLLAETGRLLGDVEDGSPESTAAILQRAEWLREALDRHTDELTELRLASLNLELGVGD
jgi:hypothetical protein